MRSQKLSYPDAMSEIIDVRSCCCPNSGFVLELNALSAEFEQKATPQSRRAKRGAAPAHLPVLSDAARRARDSRSLRGDAGTRWRVGIDPQQGHVVRVGIESDGFRSGHGVGSTQTRGEALFGVRRQVDVEAQRRRKEAREMEQLLEQQWEQQQRQQQQRAEAMQRAGSPRNRAAGSTLGLGGMYVPPASPRQRGSSSACSLAAGCTIGSHRGCLCQICFINDTAARARSARIMQQMDIHPDLAALSSFSG